MKTATIADRRGVAERRTRVLYGLMHGSLRPRRRASRRADDTGIAAVDYHEPKWLAVGALILVCSALDALLTLMLVDRGAYEVNPLMAPLVYGARMSFVLVKISVTAFGVVVLTALARLRAFRMRIGFVLYAILVGYGLLILYELWLLDRLIAAG